MSSSLESLPQEKGAGLIGRLKTGGDYPRALTFHHLIFLVQDLYFREGFEKNRTTFLF